MEKDLKTEYRGFVISYVEGGDEWRIHDNGTHGERRKKSLIECKQWVDNTFKVKKKNTFERQPGLYLRYQECEKVAVTSFAEKRYGLAYYWITSKNGKRAKVYGVRVYDEKIYADIVGKVQAREKIIEEINALYDSLPLFTEGQEEEQ